MPGRVDRAAQPCSWSRSRGETTIKTQKNKTNNIDNCAKWLRLSAPGKSHEQPLFSLRNRKQEPAARIAATHSCGDRRSQRIHGALPADADASVGACGQCSANTVRVAREAPRRCGYEDQAVSMSRS